MCSLSTELKVKGELVPWVPETFPVQFPVSVKSLFLQPCSLRERKISDTQSSELAIIKRLECWMFCMLDLLRTSNLLIFFVKAKGCISEVSYQV